ncbi:hypothetical protein MY1884_009080 [Beauveria asiatica]
MSTASDDETRWYPIGQMVETPSRAARYAVKDGADNYHDDDERTTFALSDEDMGRLNRYLHGGRVLPLDKDGFCQKLGILDRSLITDNIWTQIDRLIGTYQKIYKDCTDFLGSDSSESRRQWMKVDGDDSAFDALCTFDKMNTLASQIYDYSTKAGADDSSYYSFMFKACEKYNDDNATDKQREEARKDILDLTEDLLSDVAPMQLHAKKVSNALKDFDLACGQREAALVDSETSMTAILDKDLGNIDDLKQDISSQLDEIERNQKVIDENRYSQKMTAAYVWISVIGAIVGTTIFATKQAEINEYEKKIARLNDLIRSENDQIALHQQLQSHVTAMAKQSRDLKALIGPAMETTEKLKGGWDLIGAELQMVHDTAAKFESKIPGVNFADIQLRAIVREWNKLNKGGMNPFPPLPY